MNEKMLVSIIEKVQNGFGVERTNIDLKRSWWKFERLDEVDEFLKDICAMANTQSGESYIILGVDEKGKLFDAPMPDDEANIQSKHKDAIEPRIKLAIHEYRVEGKTLSVITIPHSTNRPHMIKKYKDMRFWIPIRFGSSTLTASRSDLDEMYNERDKSHEADVRVRLFEDKIRWGTYPAYGGCCFLVRLSIDNYGGGAPDYIVKTELKQSSGEIIWRTNHFLFEGHDFDQEIKIGPHERKQGIQLYLSNQLPSTDTTDCPFPTINENNLKLSLYSRSGATFDIPIKREWVVEK